VQTVEALIVGGGPAGSTCAWKLGQAGVDVLVLDLARFPRTKLCAGWITPEVVDDLELDIDAYPHGFMSFDKLHFHFKHFNFSKKTTQHSIRRFEFDDFLLMRSGAPVHEHKVRKIERQNGFYIIDDQYRCKYLVGAGGTRCPVYREFFHDINPRAKLLQIATYEKEFAYDWVSGECHLWFFGDGLPGYAWYVPKANGYINVGLGGKADKIKASDGRLKDYWNRFTGKLESERLVHDVEYEPTGYSYYLRGSVDVVRNDNAFIVGDAVGLASVDMGEGIGPAVHSAILAAEAIVSNSEYDLTSLARFSVPGFFRNRSKQARLSAIGDRQPLSLP
jgi:flavin-dependent dehydrogenase